jgi:hypothetical protein
MLKKQALDGGKTVALRPEDVESPRLSMPLPTGFTYRPRAEVENFELSPELLAVAAERFAQFDTYRWRAGEVRR